MSVTIRTTGDFDDPKNKKVIEVALQNGWSIEFLGEHVGPPGSNPTPQPLSVIKAQHSPRPGDLTALFERSSEDRMSA